MKMKILYLFIGVCVGGISMFLFSNYSDSSKGTTSKINFDNMDVIQFDEQYIGNENEYDENLNIIFHEDKFYLKAGEAFEYLNAIKSYRGELPINKDVSYDNMQRGKYLVRYYIYDKNNKDNYKEYIKMLVVY